MPVYDYGCDACGRFERAGPMASASADVTCPDCGREAARVFSAPGGRSARSARVLGSFDPAALARVGRAADGVPQTGALPTGRTLPGGRAPRRAPTVRPAGRRPWQLGH